MGLPRETEPIHPERASNKEIPHAESHLDGVRPLIESSFGKPGDRLPASLARTGSSGARENELANGKLDIPSIWSAQSGAGDKSKPEVVRTAETFRAGESSRTAVEHRHANPFSKSGEGHPHNNQPGVEANKHGADVVKPFVEPSHSAKPGQEIPKPGFDTVKPKLELVRPGFEAPKPHFEPVKPGFDSQKPHFEIPKPAEAPKPIHFELPKPKIEKPNPQSDMVGPDFRGQGGPAATRFNNPGAMYPGESARKFGSTATHRIGGGHLIAEFPTAIAGAAAQFDLLDSKSYHNMSVGSAIAKWSGHNGVGTYQAVLRNAGIDLRASVGSVMQDKEHAIVLARTMARVESGREFPLTKDQWGAAYDRYQGHPSAPQRSDVPPPHQNVPGGDRQIPGGDRRTQPGGDRPIPQGGDRQQPEHTVPHHGRHHSGGHHYRPSYHPHYHHRRHRY